ncbi:MAG: hypothetical protein V4679_12785 [Pseudomonadota bacterium]
MNHTTPLTPSPAAAQPLRRRAPLACLALAASLSACGGGGGDEAAGPTPADRFSVGGTVSGLVAPGAGGASAPRLVLQNNEGDDLTVTASGRFAFATPLAAGSAYAARVTSQPAGQTCTVAQGSGAVPGAAVESVQVACAPAVWGLPEGLWVREACGITGSTAGQSGRSLFRLTRQDETHVTVTQGTMVYDNAQCTGTGRVLTERDYARFEVDRKETRGAITAWWGNWNYTVSSDRPTRAVFSRSGPYMCWDVDHFWAEFSTMDKVESAVASGIRSSQCYLQAN